METTYYDTADLRLARWGCSLWFRSREGWTVKLPDTGSNGSTMERNELEFAGTAKAPPRAALQLMRAYLRSTAPQPVAHLSTLRHRVVLAGEDGQQLAEVVDDEVTVLERRRVAARFREVEVELAEGGDEALLGAVRQRLLAAGAGVADQTPKLVRAVGPKASAPPEVVPSPLPRRPTAGDLVTHALSSAVAELLANDPGVRVGDDPEAVHRARVAVRTLRSHLRTFGRLFEADPPHGDGLRTLGDELGEVRDREVMLELLRDQSEKLADGDQKGAAEVLKRLEAEIEKAKRGLAKFMDSPGYVDLLDSLVELAKAPKFNELAKLPATQVAVELARRPWRRLRKAVQALPDEPDVAQLHRIRILAKRTRYAAEAVASVAGRRAERFAEAAEALQTVLGEYRDAIVAEEWLRSAGGSGRRAYMAGKLGANVLARAEWMRARWPAKWNSLGRKRLREWFNT
jgi:CHAD domain-containing protein